MGQETTRPPDSQAGADPPDDVLGKIDELLGRHRPKPASAGAIPVLTDPSSGDGRPASDGIPVLTDVVAGPGQDATRRPLPQRSGDLNSTTVVRRMSMALDLEHARLSAHIAGDIAQARMLDALVAELKRALPAAVRAALSDKTTGPAQPPDNAQL